MLGDVAFLYFLKNSRKSPLLNGLSFVRRTDNAVYHVSLLLEQSSSRNNKNCSMEMLILVV
jgi:hypothetical protein